jgi:predicted nucleotidyltransferase
MKVETVKVQGQTLRIASIADLIRMKQGTGRAQDQEDIKALKRLR